MAEGAVAGYTAQNAGSGDRPHSQALALAEDVAAGAVSCIEEVAASIPEDQTLDAGRRGEPEPDPEPESDPPCWHPTQEEVAEAHDARSRK